MRGGESFGSPTTVFDHGIRQKFLQEGSQPSVGYFTTPRISDVERITIPEGLTSAPEPPIFTEVGSIMGKGRDFRGTANQAAKAVLQENQALKDLARERKAMEDARKEAYRVQLTGGGLHNTSVEATFHEDDLSRIAYN
jgi:hypothetical protein